MLPVGKIKYLRHNQSVNGRLHFKNIWYDEIGKCKTLCTVPVVNTVHEAKKILVNFYGRKILYI